MRKVWCKASINLLAGFAARTEAVREMQPREAEPHPETMLLEVTHELTAAPHLGSSSSDDPVLRGLTRGAAVTLATMKYGPHHLHALRVDSPARARDATPPFWAGEEVASKVMPGEPCVFSWTRDGHELEVKVNRLEKHTAYLCVPSESCSPEAARRATMRYGLDLYAAMLEDGMRSNGLLLEQLVLALVEWGVEGSPDVGLYVVGDGLMERGRVEYRRAMASLDRAIRDGWPGWQSLGIQLLDIGQKGER